MDDLASVLFAHFAVAIAQQPLTDDGGTADEGDMPVL